MSSRARPRGASTTSDTVATTARAWAGERVGALFVHGLRAVFGLGRSGRAKVAPLILGGLIALPAVVSVGFGALIGGAEGPGGGGEDLNPITLEGYLSLRRDAARLLRGRPGAGAPACATNATGS